MEKKKIKETATKQLVARMISRARIFLKKLTVFNFFEKAY